MRRLYELGAFLLGSLGAVLVFYPVGIHRLIRFELWRWWGLLGIAGAVILAHAAARMREISVPDDIEEQIDAAERDGDWEQVWNFRSLQADAARQAGDYEREEWARNKLVDLALEHVEHGVFRALSQLERLRIIAPENT
ncbi:MAG: hypothetical protein ABEL76_05885 [Bradymonadaceae bacterium]